MSQARIETRVEKLENTLKVNQKPTKVYLPIELRRKYDKNFKEPIKAEGIKEEE